MAGDPGPGVLRRGEPADAADRRRARHHRPQARGRGAEGLRSKQDRVLERPLARASQPSDADQDQPLPPQAQAPGGRRGQEGRRGDRASGGSAHPAGGRPARREPHHPWQSSASARKARSVGRGPPDRRGPRFSGPAGRARPRNPIACPRGLGGRRRIPVHPDRVQSARKRHQVHAARRARSRCRSPATERGGRSCG